MEESQPIQPLDLQRITDLRREAAAGKQFTPDEYREIVAYLRQGRISAVGAKKKAPKASSLPVDLKDLFGG